MQQTKPMFGRLLRSPAWKWSGDYSGRMGSDGQKKKMGKANEKKDEVKKKQKISEWTREEERGTLSIHRIQRGSA